MRQRAAPVDDAGTAHASPSGMTPITLHRRTVVQALLLTLAAAATKAQDALPTIAVLPLDFIDDHLNPDTVDAQNRRLKQAHAQLRQELGERRLYRVVDLAPAAPLIAELLARQSFLYRCDDCVLQVGRRLGSDLVMASWVQKVSELILNFNVEVWRVADGRSLLSKSVDMRGNQDASWERSVRYLVRDMADKRAADPHYGF
jgi:hypothetical protein